MKYAKLEQRRNGFPYFKVQYWDDKNICWGEIQKSFVYPEEAISFGNTLKKVTRLMIVYRDHREVYV